MVQRTIAPTEAILEALDALQAEAGEDAVFVDADGIPKGALISIERYEHLRALDLAEKRREALAWLDAYEASYDGRNDDLTDE
ncbi:MAG TPA: hypothetical protein VD767_07545, partial [Thermomicrobiales bacterium]|nr:hypothetical protein [Thermomicrobiales bacterium]